MKNTFLVVTSIADQNNKVLKKFAEESVANNTPFVVIGDIKSPDNFSLSGCDFYSIERQNNLNFELAKILPTKHYARKNLGYLVAMSEGAEVIIETDDDNLPMEAFWNNRKKEVDAYLLINKDWVNIYQYFTDTKIWPRGFALENIQNKALELKDKKMISCPIQQGLADENPDVDAIYRLIFYSPITFNKSESVALGENSICPFNSQNTTWFKEAFPLLYLPSYCSFRMTDIWRSFVAQRIAWACGWPILFHQSTVWQERNDHNLMKDFQDEIVGYNNNVRIWKSFKELDLKKGTANIPFNMVKCYQNLVDLGLVDKRELDLLSAWLRDIELILKNKYT